MSTRSELNVRNLPLANIAPGAAATNRKCSYLLSAAPPTRSGTKPAMQPMPSPPAPGSVSCHEKHVTDTVLRTFCTRTSSFCALSALECHHFAHFQSKTDRELTATASCHESPCPYPVTRTKENFQSQALLGKSIQFDTLSIPCRYPISEKFAAGLRHIWTLLAQYWTIPAPFLRTCAALPSRRLSSPRNSMPISARAGEVARDEALYSLQCRTPSTSPPSNPSPKTPVQQRKNQVDAFSSHDDVRAMLAHRARLPSQQWRKYPA